MFDSNTFNPFSICKEMINIEYNYQSYVAILENILQSSNKWLIVNRIIRVWNTWNPLTECKKRDQAYLKMLSTGMCQQITY